MPGPADWYDPDHEWDSQDSNEYQDRLEAGLEVDDCCADDNCESCDDE